MSNSRVARRYAQALFETAVEKKQLAAVNADFAKLSEHLSQVPALQKMLMSPIVPRDEKLDSFRKAYGKGLQPLTMTFVELLMGKGRESLLSAVAGAFQEKVDAHEGVVRGELFSVLPLNGKQREALTATMGKITGKKVLLTEKIDEKLLGGVMVRIGDMVYDASLRHQLVKLRENLAQS